MSKILINNGASDVEIVDTGVTVAAGDSYTIPPQDYPTFAASSDVIELLASATLVLNDGGDDITNLSQAVDIIKGWCPAGSSLSTPFFFDYTGDVSGDAAVTLISHTVVGPVDSVYLARVYVACRIEAVIQVFKNAQVIGSIRTGAAKPDGIFEWSPNRECLVGDLIEVILTKRGSTPDITVNAFLQGVTSTPT